MFSQKQIFVYPKEVLEKIAEVQNGYYETVHGNTKKTQKDKNIFYGPGTVIRWTTWFPAFDNNTPKDQVPFTEKDFNKALQESNLDIIFPNGYLWPIEQIVVDPGNRIN